jgi:hypothetical protein
MPDFSQPGSDGDSSVSFEPSGFADWRRGVVYTVRPEMLAPLPRGEERRIGVSIRRHIGKREPFASYADLYHRAAEIGARRVEEIKSADPACSVHSWTATHAWGRFEGRIDFLYTFVTLGVVSLSPSDPRPEGEGAPMAEALLAPGGLSKEMVAALGQDHWKRIDEFYNDFDFPDASASSAYMFSYGEYVPSRDRLDYAPIVERAQWRARQHVPESRIVRREWYSTSAPDLAVVHVYLGT